jgi:hypothetical protein
MAIPDFATPLVTRLQELVSKETGEHVGDAPGLGHTTMWPATGLQQGRRKDNRAVIRRKATGPEWGARHPAHSLPFDSVSLALSFH